ncbi:PREDICTED: pentatricopeptide repeat-containing protein At2g21090 [Tarenaya hassleriana]|uniref:pentatricopeptide repeat-containing protein At2g21090 n=1 Tax=Tarenaya hassleriana TaxID=28532 RepID=UPI00053C0C74|nr:PREDICTED: pentatricopeptide repeat-containing protein At2g21090 [Tarenaya hassleriana]
MPIGNPRKRPIRVVGSFSRPSSNAQLSDAVSRLESLTRKGVRLPVEVLVSLLRRCADTRSLREGKCIHLHLKITGFKRANTLLSNHLIGMYMKCGKHIDARKVFDKMHIRNLYSWNNMISGYVKSGMLVRARALFDSMPERDVVSWNTMVIGYAHNGDLREALGFYRELRRSEIRCNEFSFAGLLTACVKSRNLELTRQAHGQVLIAGLLTNVVLSCSIIDAYAKCGEMSDARRCFNHMPVKDIYVWTALVSGYAQLGDVESAETLFHEMPEKNPVSWTALIAGHVRQGSGYKALELFGKMMALGMEPEQFTLSSCLCACASIASLKHGKQIHGYMLRTNVRPNTIVLSSLIDMYSKSGSLDAGKRVFNLTTNKHDCVLWNTLISALAQHGLGHEAMHILDDMIKARVHPDRTTLVVILNACCSHSGLIEEGLRWFESMTRHQGIVPDEEHYACLIDLLGCAGRFSELMKQIETMPFQPDERIWNAILGVCSIRGNVELGTEAAKELIKLDPESSAPYILLASIYAMRGEWESVEKLRRVVEKREPTKGKALSWIEIEDKVHAFTVADGSHTHKQEIYSALNNLVALTGKEFSS